MIKTKYEYEKSFELTLTKQFKRDIPQTREKLAFKMTESHYRRKKIYDEQHKEFYIDDQYPVSKKQIDYAWTFLNKNKKQSIGKQTRLD